MPQIGPSPASTTRAQNEAKPSMRCGIATLTKVAGSSSRKLIPKDQILNRAERIRIVQAFIG